MTDDSSEIECLFIERTKQLLKPGGWAGIILPSSILSNSGIYTDAREIILKYFSIKAIAEFGSNTFMATGTNTVTLFMERKANNDWKKIEAAIKSFFDKPKETTVNGIEKAFTKYADEVFEDITLQDYISLANKKPNETISKTELFTDYQSWFNNLTEIKNIKKRHKNALDKLKVNLKKEKDDKKKAATQKELVKLETEQSKELEKLFYQKVFTKEQDKMLYFFLAQPQQTVLIKVGEKQAEKDFIGYEFSNRRGHEGIRMHRDEFGKVSTKLYDDDNPLNEEKANSYVYRAFLGEQVDIEESLQNNLTTFDLTELMDFKKLSFEKSISLGVKKKIEFKSSKYELQKIGTLCEFNYGISLPEQSRKKGKYPVLGSNGRVGFHNEYLIEGPSIIIGRKGSVGEVTWEEENCTPIDTTFYITLINTTVNLRFLYYLLKALKLDTLKGGTGVPGLNRNDAYEIKVPLPSEILQEKIINEIAVVEKKEKAGKEKLVRLNADILKSFNSLSEGFDKVPLGKIIALQNGKGLSSAKMINGEYLVYGGNGINGAHNAFVSEKATIAIGRVGAYCGAVHLTQPKSWITDNSMFVNQFLKDLNLKYLYYALKNLNLNQFANQSSHPNISQPTVLGQKIPFPVKKEQDQIISKIEKLETEIAQIESELATIDEQKEQILRKYLE